MDIRSIEEPLISQAKMNEYKQREFREYLVKQEMSLAIVKFLLSIRNAKEKPDSPSQALLDYFGSYKNDSWKEFNSLEEQVNDLRQENDGLQNLVVELQQKIVQAKEEALRREEEEKQKELEALNKKDNKKQAKK